MLAGVPLYKVWVVVSKRTATPLNATWAMTALAFFLGLPILFSPSTFLAMGSISFAGLYISCKSLPSPGSAMSQKQLCSAFQQLSIGLAPPLSQRAMRSWIGRPSARKP